MCVVMLFNQALDDTTTITTDTDTTNTNITDTTTGPGIA